MVLAFDKDDFWIKIMSLYDSARESNYIMKLGKEQIRELKGLFLNLYVSEENLCHYDDAKIMTEMMRKIVSIYRLDKDTVSNYAELVELVNTVNYDGQYLYIHYARISPIRLRRLSIGKTRKQVAEKMGYSTATLRHCEEVWFDIERQPETLVRKLCRALEWSEEEMRAAIS